MREDERKERSLDAEAIFKPWEMIGESRRDSLPHRARALTVLARTALFASGLGFLCPLLSLTGIVLGLTTRILARRDLDLICAGEMDQDGYVLTGKAWAEARVALILGFLGSIWWIFVLWLVWLKL